jgi:hypothetical protein
MVEQLLNEFCSIGGVHLGNADRRDVFRVVAWCSKPSRVPSEMDLDIIEPPLSDDISGLVKRILRYPISITVTHFNQPSTVGDPPCPPLADEGWGRCRRRRCRQNNPSTAVAPGAVGSEVSTMMTVPRVQVHARLVPQQSEGYQVLQDVLASAAPGIDCSSLVESS